MADIVISRLELYPNVEEATGYAVGFSVASGNAKSFYLDTVVDIKDEDEKKSSYSLGSGGSDHNESEEDSVIQKNSKLFKVELKQELILMHLIVIFQQLVLMVLLLLLLVFSIMTLLLKHLGLMMKLEFI